MLTAAGVPTIVEWQSFLGDGASGGEQAPKTGRMAEQVRAGCPVLVMRGVGMLAVTAQPGLVRCLAGLASRRPMPGCRAQG